MMRHKSAVILGLLLLVFGLRLYRVTSVPLSRDEIVTIKQYIPLSIIGIFQTHHSNNHPLISALAHIFSLQADNLFMLRWPSILVGIIALPFVYRLGVGLFDWRVGLLALFLASVTPVYIGYSVIIRGYGGLISLTVIALYFLWHALRHNRWRDWLGLTISAVLVAFFHLFSLLAIGLALGLVGAYLLWQRVHPIAFLPPVRLIWPKFVGVILILMTIYGLIVFVRVTSVLDEGGYSGEFELWRNGFWQAEDFLPLTIFIGFLGPMSPSNWAAYLFGLFSLVGLSLIWQRQRFAAIALAIWFVTPFGLILIGMQLLGQGFYAYVRFLLYMLPVFLLLTAAGMVACADWFSDWALRQGRAWPEIAYWLKWLAVTGLLVITLVSLNWYFLRAVNTDWPDLAAVLSQQQQPQDIVICEEYQRNFEAPDRAKPYCMWMLDFFTDLKEYTPNFQSSTDFIANYENIQTQREQMLAPGNVWLIIWQKIPFNVEHLITDTPPILKSLPSAAALTPYQSWPFGSATLVKVDSAESLLGNIYRAVNLLAQLEETPAAQARYYRSLAELEAIQGHKSTARSFFEQSWHLAEQSGGIYPDQFLDQTRQFIARLPDPLPFSSNGVVTNKKFGSALCLQGYEVTPEVLIAGQPLQLKLFWHPLNFVPENYTFFISLEDGPKSPPIKLEFQPFDGVYPTPWWWAGQEITELRRFQLPPNLPQQDYVAQLGAYDPQNPGQTALSPLFAMRYQPGRGWQIEPSPVLPDTECVQPE